MEPQSLNQIRYLSGDGQGYTTAKITLPADGQFATRATVEALDAGGLLKFIPMGQVGDKSGGKRFRGIRVTPFGKGANNGTFTQYIYAAHFYGDESTGGQAGPVELRLLASIACTRANALGSGGMIGAAERLVDTVVMTKSAYLTALESAMTLTTGAGALSPTNDTQGCFWIPDCGNAAAIVIDSLVSSGETSNALIQRDI